MDRRSRREAARKSGEPMAKAMVYIPIPEDDFLDLTGEAWTLRRQDGSIEELDLPGVIAHTIRRLPAKNFGDAERALDILQVVRGDVNGHIPLSKDDFDWMIRQFKDSAYVIWLAPDSAYLVRYLELMVTATVPESRETG